jgi:hypothetical protein
MHFTSRRTPTAQDLQKHDPLVDRKPSMHHHFIMVDIQVIDDPETATVASAPVRSRLLSEMAVPASALLTSCAMPRRQFSHGHRHIKNDNGLPTWKLLAMRDCTNGRVFRGIDLGTFKEILAGTIHTTDCFPSARNNNRSLCETDSITYL